MIWWWFYDDFMMMLWWFWDHFGIILGSFWDRFGIILGSFWDPFGILLGSLWDRFGIVLGSFWDHFGIIFATFLEEKYQKKKKIQKLHEMGLEQRFRSISTRKMHEISARIQWNRSQASKTLLKNKKISILFEIILKFRTPLGPGNVSAQWKSCRAMLPKLPDFETKT